MSFTREALDEIANSSPLYWRIILSERTGEFVACCLQWFDEYDYDQKRFASGEIDNEDEAELQAAQLNASSLPHVRRYVQLGLRKDQSLGHWTRTE